MAKTSRPFPEVAAVQATRKGERNPDLQHVQHYPTRFSYLDGRYDAGELGPETSIALTRYHEFHKLPVTGDKTALILEEIAHFSSEEKPQT